MSGTGLDVQASRRVLRGTENTRDLRRVRKGTGGISVDVEG